MRKAIEIGDKEFATKKDALHHFKTILNSYDFGETLYYGNPNENSDYDVLIVLKNDYNARDENQIYDLCYDMNLKYNIIIDAHLISERELQTIKGKQPIFTKAIKSGIYA